MKKSLYPKTKRIDKNGEQIFITEKLDGSNIGFFKLNDDLVIATRDNVFMYSEVQEHEGLLYKGMKVWLEENATVLINSLHPNSGFFAEWIGIGVLKYPEYSNRVYMFAKANITEDLSIKNLYYNPNLFIYPFVDQEVPEFISFVPIVKQLTAYPNVVELDELYDKYTQEVQRNVEGFVINNNNTIKKYVRMKNGKLKPHKS